jgi:hypothetical protein
MTNYKHEAKQAAQDKMKRMGLNKEHSGKNHFDDVHPYDGVPQLSTTTPSGAAPVGKQRFKRGGKVAHLEGNKAKQNLGKASRSKAPIPYERDEELKSGGVAAFNPLLRKKRAAAMAMRKKREGLPYGAPTVATPSSAMSMPTGSIMPRKKGGVVASHPDEAEDRKLIRKEVKPSALKNRAHKNSGGAMNKLKDLLKTTDPRDQGNLRPPTPGNPNNAVGSSFGAEDFGEKPGSWVQAPIKNLMHEKKGGRIRKNDGGGLRSERTQYEKARRESVNQGMDLDTDSQHTQDTLRKAVRNYENTAKETGYSNLKTGGRAHRATGGKVGNSKGKTSINIIIAPESQKGASQMPAGGPPALPPQLLAAMAGGAGGPPPGMMPPGPPPGMMPPGAGMAGAGGGLGAGPAMNVGRPGMTAPTPPMRKSGGRVGGKAPQAATPTHQEHDYGSGSGLGRLEKRKWPLA